MKPILATMKRYVEPLVDKPPDERVVILKSVIDDVGAEVHLIINEQRELSWTRGSFRVSGIVVGDAARVDLWLDIGVIA